jgi:hypothetical protein
MQPERIAACGLARSVAVAMTAISLATVAPVMALSWSWGCSQCS